jgi:hypothetical protein
LFPPCVVHSADNTIGVFLGYDNGSFTDQIIYPTGTDSLQYLLEIADFNNDIHPDIIITNTDTSKVFVFLGYSDGTFQDRKEFMMGYGTHPISLAVGDLNNDKNKYGYKLVNFRLYFLCLK